MAIASTSNAESRRWDGMDECDDRLPGLSRFGARAIREPFPILDADFRVRVANSAFYRTLQSDADEGLDRLVDELRLAGQWGDGTPIRFSPPAERVA